MEPILTPESHSFELPDETLVPAVEALIFAADAPIDFGRLAEIIGQVTGSEIAPQRLDAAVQTLNERYEGSGSALRIEQWAGGFRMATETSVASYLKTMFATRTVQRLSRSVMETLAVIAYRQPVTRPEVDYVRGVNSDYALKKLLEAGFISVTGRSEAVGQPLLYGTTKLFLEQFGLNDLQELPRIREIEELLSDPAFEKERQELLMLEKVEHLEAKHNVLQSGASSDGETE